MDSKQLMEALLSRHQNRGMGNKWGTFPELRCGTGYGHNAETRIDLWVMGMWESIRHVRIAYEIKASRSDFLRELKNPLKRRMALLVSNEFYFVTPVGLIKPEELPIECGLMEVFLGGVDKDRPYAQIIHQAPWRDTPPPSWRFFAAIARRVWNAEAQAT
jgi:hypothetical protein